MARGQVSETISSNFSDRFRNLWDKASSRFQDVTVEIPPEEEEAAVQEERKEQPNEISSPYAAIDNLALGEISQEEKANRAAAERRRRARLEKMGLGGLDAYVSEIHSPSKIEASQVKPFDYEEAKQQVMKEAWDDTMSSYSQMRLLPMTQEEAVRGDLSPETREYLDNFLPADVAAAERIAREQNEIGGVQKNTFVDEHEKEIKTKTKSKHEADKEARKKHQEDLDLSAEENTNYVVDSNGTTRESWQPSWEVTPEHLRPRVMETDENGETNVRQEPPKKRLLLPGRVNVKDYSVPEDIRKKGKRKSKVIKGKDGSPDRIILGGRGKPLTVDQMIDEAMGKFSILSFFKNRRVIPELEQTLEDYGKDFDEGKRDYGRYDLDKSDAELEAEEALRTQLEFIGKCFLPIESQTIRKDGSIGWDPRTEQKMAEFMNKMHLAKEDTWLMFFIISKRLGYSPDSNGKFLLQDSNKIPDWLIVKALDDALTSQAVYGHPYKLLDTAQARYGNTVCYPIGVMTIEEAQILCASGGVCEGRDPWDLVTDVRDDFVNNTLPEIRREAHRHKNSVAQMLVLENYVRALCSLDNISPRMYNISETRDRGYEEFEKENSPELNPNVDPEIQENRKTIVQRARRRRDRARKKLDKRRNKVKAYYKEDVIDPTTGEIIHNRGERVDWNDCIDGSVRYELRSSKLAPVDAFFNFTANWAKIMGIIGFAPVIASGYAEHFTGNINVSITNRILGGIYDTIGDNGEAYRPTELMYARMCEDESVEAINAWKALLRAGGQDAVMLFYTRYKSMNRANVRKFLSEDVNKEALFTGKNARKVKEIARKAEEAMSVLLPGDLGFGKQDAKRWLEGLMINMQQLSMTKNPIENSYTAKEIMEMMDTMGMDRFIASMTQTVAGRDAAVMMRNSTLAKESPLSHLCDMILRRSGLTNAIVTLGIDTYFTYGVNLVQAMVPFSNTFSYLAVKGIDKIAGSTNEETRDLGLEIMEYQMGGLDSFGMGLVKNLMYDFVKCGNVAIFGTFMYVIFSMIGFDEPEDERNKYNWEEYRIGRKIALGGYDENGNPQGIPLFRAWWLDDLTLFGLPMAYALCCRDLDQKLGDNDPDLPRKIFHSACYEVVSGASLFDLGRSIKNAKEVIVMYDKLSSDPDSLEPENFADFMWMEFAELPLARAANKLFVPNFLRDAFKDRFDHTPFQVYNRESNTPGATKSTGSWRDVQKRIESSRNPIYALFNNRVENGYWTDDGTTDKTGYFATEMPIATTPDQLVVSFLEKLDYDPDAIDEETGKRVIPLDEKQAYIDDKCELILSYIDKYGDVDVAVSNGFAIPFDLRWELSKYCRRMQNYSENVYNDLCNAGISGVAKNNAYTEMSNRKAYYKAILDDWVWNTEDIPWSSKGYAKLRTDTKAIYSFKSTGKPASALDYIELGPEAVDKHYMPKGNTPNQFALFTSPNTEGTGHNYETVSSWYKEGITDLQAIFDWAEENNVVVPKGLSEGVLLNNAIFGGSPDFKTDTENPIKSDNYAAMDVPTMDRRGYVPYDESLLLELPNYKSEAIATSLAAMLKQVTQDNVDGGSLGEMGTRLGTTNGKTTSKPSYGGSRGGGYRRSSGSSGSNPRIYNSSIGAYSNIPSTHISSTRTSPDQRSVNADRPVTMYSKTPQDTTSTYLRPGFSTKGSREAYERQDI